MEQIKCAGVVVVAVAVVVVVVADVVGTPKGVVLAGGTQTILAGSEVFVAGMQRAGFSVLSDPIAETRQFRSEAAHRLSGLFNAATNRVDISATSVPTSRRSRALTNGQYLPIAPLKS